MAHHCLLFSKSWCKKCAHKRVNTKMIPVENCSMNWGKRGYKGVVEGVNSSIIQLIHYKKPL
jgi:hypothetical protein